MLRGERSKSHVVISYESKNVELVLLQYDLFYCYVQILTAVATYRH